ncbi:MAG: chaperone modulator CbpM [Chitinophagaceae bacterium]
MENNELVPVYSFCVTHKIELSFIESLQQYGLVEITTIEEQTYFNESQLSEVEKFVRLHYELDINFEGIEAIGHLLEKIKAMQARNLQLQNRLSLYEKKSGDF